MTNLSSITIARYYKKDLKWFSLVTQNTFAINLFKKGQREDGMELLEEVLCEIKERCNGGPSWKLVRPTAPLETEILVDPTGGRDFSSTGGKIFHRAFHLPDDKPLSICSIDAVVNFNYGVATHIAAIEEDSHAKLEMALKYYQHVICVDISEKEISTLTPVHAAAMHNMSAICSACKLDKRARSIRAILSAVLELSSPSFDAPETQEFFQRSAKAA